MNQKTLKCNDVVVNKKEFHTSKQTIALNSVLIKLKFKHSDKCSKYFIGHKENDIIRPLCILLPQMSGYIKYFDNGEGKICFKI